MATDVGSATGYLDLDISGFLAGLQSAQSAADKQTKNMATKIGKNMSDVGGKLSSVGSTLTKYVSVPLAGIGTIGLKTAMNFEKGMSEVRAISGATGKDFDALRNKAIELGADTAFSASTVASAMTEMAKAGWSSQQILDGMGGVLDAAAASGEGLATVATIVADAITGFGMAASDSTRVADLLTQAANSGTIGIADLGETFKYIAPVAGAMGLSIEDVTTAVAAMSMAGIKGSQAGTALRTVLTNLVYPSEVVSETMGRLSISATNADGSMKSLDQIVADLRVAFDGLTDAEKASNAAMIAGKEGMSGLLALLNLTEEEYNAIAASMENANGVAQETASIMQDNLQSKVEQLGGSLESLAIKMGDLVIPYAQQLVEGLTRLVDKFTALDPQTQAFILKVAGIAAVVGPAILVIGKLTSGLGGVITAFGNLAAKFGGAKTAVTAVGNAAGTAAGGASKGAASFGNLAGQGVKLVAAGASFLMVATGIKMIADSAIAVASAGPGAAAAFALLVAGAVGLTAAIVAIGGAATATSAGLLAMSASVALVTAGIALLVAAVGSATSKVLTAFEKVITATGKAAIDAGNGFETLSNAIMNLVNNTGALDLAATLGAVAKGVDEINDAAKNSAQAGQAVTAFTQSISTGAQTATTSINNVIAVIRSAQASLNSFRAVVDNFSQAFTSAFSVKIKSAITDFNTNINNANTRLNVATAQMSTSIKTMADNSKTSLSVFVSNVKSSVAEVEAEIKKLQQTFANTKFEFNQHIALPHFSMSGKFDAQSGSVPSVGVQWYKNAMSGGMILDAATIFGFDPRTGKFLGAGEAGSETVVGTSSLMKMIRGSVAEAISPMIEVMFQLTKASYELGYITNNAFAKQAQVYEQVVRSRGDGSGGGDTYNFYSPKALDEIEAAKQMKIAKRDMTEGF